MDKKVLIAFSGGQPAHYMLDLLAYVAQQEASDIGYYLPRPTSLAACAQRAYVCIGSQTACKEFLPGEADVLLAMEELEGRRGVRFLSKEGILILCSCHRLPMSVSVGTTGYPTDILYRSVSEGRRVLQIKRTEMEIPIIGATLLRALGYDAPTAQTMLAGCRLTIEDSDLALVYSKEYSK